MPATKTQRARREVPKLKARIGELEAELAGAAQALEISNQTAVAEHRSATARIEQLYAENNLLRRQGWHVRQTLDAMFQRYIGAKLDVQAMNVDQANAWLANERGSVEAALARINAELEATSGAEASNGKSWTAEYVATPVAEAE